MKNKAGQLNTLADNPHYLIKVVSKANSLGLQLVYGLLALYAVSCQKPLEQSSTLKVNLLSKEKDFTIKSRSGEEYREEQKRDFNLIHTDLHLEPLWESEQMKGNATLTLKPHFFDQKELFLDAKGFDLHRVCEISLKDTIPLKFEYDSLKLKILFKKEISRNDAINIFIEYTANPNRIGESKRLNVSSGKGLYFINSKKTNPFKPKQIWTQGETESNSCWFPTLDRPNQKMSQDIWITVDTTYETLSNGKLVSQSFNSDGKRIDHWQQQKKHAPYLAAWVIGDFEIINDEWNEIPLSYYLERDYAPYHQSIFGKTPEMLSFFSEKFGFEYPWGKYAQVIVRDFPAGAMENTTATIFYEGLLVDDRFFVDDNWEQIIAHELSHHWFGDLVTCESWSNLPLNESFATYSEYLWVEHSLGKEEADFVRKRNWDNYLEEYKSKKEPLIRYYYNDSEDLFDNHSYDKGGVILHYLRSIIGDEAFFEGIKKYLNNFAFKKAETDQLRLVFEETTGWDLNWFFNQWFFQEGHPKLFVKKEYDKTEKKLFLTVYQETVGEGSNLNWKLPFEVEIWSSSDSLTYSFVLKENKQVFEIDLQKEPDLLIFNPKNYLPAEVDFIKTDDEFIAQFQKSKSPLKRLEALSALSTGLNDSSISMAFIQAVNDESMWVRSYAVEKLAELNENYQGDVVAILSQKAVNDLSSMVRVSALISLNSLGNFPDILEQTERDSSYSVLITSLYGLSKVLYDESLQQRLERHENSMSHDVLTALADLYSEHSISGKKRFFEVCIQKMYGYRKSLAINHYGEYLLKFPQLQKEGGEFLLKILSEEDNADMKISIYQSLLLLEDSEIKKRIKTSLEKEKEEKVMQYLEFLEVK